MSDCHVCDSLGKLTPEVTVYDNGPWVAFKMADVPGWIQLAAKTHGDGIAELTDDEADTLGRAARTVNAALKKVTGAELVHCVYLGSGAKHYHMGMFPRLPGQDALFSTQPLRDGIKNDADPDSALKLCADVRDEIAASQ